MPFHALELALAAIDQLATVEAKLRKRRKSLADQVARAADSVALNVAEGSSRAGLDRISVGPIGIADVRALVARRGALVQSLLGMTFLKRLESYSVERGRLALKGR